MCTQDTMESGSDLGKRMLYGVMAGEYLISVLHESMVGYAVMLDGSAGY